MRKLVVLLSLVISMFADDIVVYDNEYKILELEKKIKKLVIGNRDSINVSLLPSKGHAGTVLKIFGKKTGSTSILIVYKDGTMQNYHVYINENLGFVQKMINVIEPNLKLSKVGDGSTVITGKFDNPHVKSRIFALLKSAGVDMARLMDLTQTKKVNKMVRTKLYLVEINNNKARDIGGVTGMSFFNKYVKAGLNPTALNGATFSGWLLDNIGNFTLREGRSVTGTLNFLEQAGIGKILDDTVLITTEDKNASFRVGGEVYIPTGMTQNAGFAPTIELEEKEYGLKLVLTTKFMEKENFMRIEVDIKNSQFDTDRTHDVALGNGVFVPSFVSKNIQTNVVMSSGQVLALGGRLHSEDIESEEKIPFLGDIPLLGELFKHTVKGTKGNDLLFFLVPEIVDANEEVDDLHYYKEYKDETKRFHKEALDMYHQKKKAKDSLVLMQPKPQVLEVSAQEAAAVSKESDEDIMMSIEDEPTYVETQKPAIREQKAQIIVPQVESTEDETAFYVDKSKVQPKPTKEIQGDENAETVKPTQVQEDTLAKKESMPDTTVSTGENEHTKQLYEVAVGKIFLRSTPVNGKRVTVWKKHHKFTVEDEKDVNGQTWMKVKEDCYKECELLSKPLWISKRYVEEVL